MIKFKREGAAYLLLIQLGLILGIPKNFSFDVAEMALLRIVIMSIKPIW